MSRVLIVEDEAHLATGLQFNLQAEGHSADVAGDGETALDLLLKESKTFDALVLDIMLPGKDGFEVASELRAARNYIPILMLTARSRPEDVLKGFASGADDYVAKPFELPIFLARLQGLLRRREWMQHVPSVEKPVGRSEENPSIADDDSNQEFGTFTFDGKTVDFGNLELRTNETTTRLTVMEAEFLRYLIRNRGRVVSRKSILEDVWALREDTDTRAIDNFIVRLRRYIEKNPSHPQHLLTVRGVGYRFEANVE
ncbi:MAG TPA: response regulator transcription factor [Terriglobales bacterium]|nr:response regulator transcription factor [Terriglobales bacterium]